MGSGRGIEVSEHSPFAVRQSLKFNVRDVVTRGAVGFAVGGSPLECNRGVWYITIVLKLISRPLHHTLREHAPCSRPSGRRRAEGITAVDLTVLGASPIPFVDRRSQHELG